MNSYFRPFLAGTRGILGGCAAAVLMITTAAPAGGPTPATYIGPSGGNWSEPTNWDIGNVPLNDDVNSFSVTIPAGVTVNFDIDGAINNISTRGLQSGGENFFITALALGDNARINLTQDRGLTVLEAADLGGLIHATGTDAAFNALSPLSTFSPDGRGRAFALNGAAVEILAPSYFGNFGGTASWDIFLADGRASSLDLSALTSLTLPNGDYVLTRTFAITASNTGVIDLSNVQTVQGATGNNWARFNVLSGGEIKLDSLQSITDRARFQIGVPLYSLPALETVTGASIFDIDAASTLGLESGGENLGSGNTLDLPSLTSMSGATLNLGSGATIAAPNLAAFTNGFISIGPATTLTTAALTQFDNSRAAVNAGSVFDAVATPSYTFHPGGTSSWDVFTASDAGSLIDLTSLSSMSIPDAGYVLTRTFALTASDQGVIDLSNVATLEGAGGNNWVRFNILSDGDIKLDSLQSITGRTYFRAEVPFYELPALTMITGASTFSVSAGSTISLPLITALSSATLQIDDGGTIDAPNLSSFTGGFLQYNATTTFNSPPITSFDNSRIFVSGGATFDRVTASTYAFNPGGTSSWDVFRATDAGSLLDLTSLTSLSLPDAGYVLTRTFAITASNGGVIDLSNVTALEGPAGNNWARFNALSGGQINLDSLEVMTGRAFFRVEVPMFELPSLSSVLGATTFSVGPGSTISMPLVTTLVSSTVTIDDGGTIDVPMLNSFTNGFISRYTPATTLISLPFTEFDNSRIVVSDGAVFDRVSASSYTFNPGGTSSWDVFTVTGSDSTLDLTSLTSLSIPDSGYVLTRNFTLTASNGGLIDLSNVNDVEGPGGNNWARFHINDGGAMRFGDTVFSPGRSRIAVSDPGSRIQFHGSAVFPVPTEVSVGDGSLMSVRGDLVFNHTNEALFRLDRGILMMHGNHEQSLEVGGENIGLPNGELPLNFQIGQLIVGDEAQTSIVVLIDDIDNGNRGPKVQPESLYLEGFESDGEFVAEDGLRILCDSTLYLNGINTYAVIDGTWTLLSDLFPEGVYEIAFDEGWINLRSPAECGVGDLNCNGTVGAADLEILLAEWGACATVCDRCIADLNGDGLVNALDLLILFSNWR